MALNTAQLSLIEQRLANEAPSLALCYVLWAFLGWVGAHRFYVGRGRSAVMLILCFIIVIGFIWWLIDVALIPEMVRERRNQIRQRLITEMLAAQGESLAVA